MIEQDLRVIERLSKDICEEMGKLLSETLDVSKKMWMLDKGPSEDIERIMRDTLRSCKVIEYFSETFSSMNNDDKISEIDSFDIYESVDLALVVLDLGSEGVLRVEDRKYGAHNMPLKHKGKTYIRGQHKKSIKAIGNRGLTGLVWMNLFSNACKYGKTYTKFGISDLHDYVRCFVENDADKLIPSEYRDKIFQPYERVPGNKADGLGLGLSLAKRIVERHGGEIWLEQTKGKVRFYFTLPSADYRNQ